MIAFFQSFTSSFSALLHTREAIGKLIRLKTASKTSLEERQEKFKNFKGEIGDSIAIIEVLDKTNIRATHWAKK